VGHGTRDPLGQRQFHALVDQVSARLPIPVAGAFLELALPDLPTALAQLQSAGARDIHLQPVFLFAAGHLKQDLPELLRRIPTSAGLNWTLGVPLSFQPGLVRISLDRFDEAIRPHPPAANQQTVLIIVGRGSSDPQAVADFHRFARMRFDARPVGILETAFLDAAQPRLEASVPCIADLPYARIVLQPHLLFEGTLMHLLRRRVEEWRTQWQHREWILTDVLGAHPHLAEVVADLAVGGAGGDNSR
jgi:sirohydrochlorin cobaltochelatase